MTVVLATVRTVTQSLLGWLLHEQLHCLLPVCYTRASVLVGTVRIPSHRSLAACRRRKPRSCTDLKDLAMPPSALAANFPEQTIQTRDSALTAAPIVVCRYSGLAHAVSEDEVDDVVVTLRELLPPLPADYGPVCD